MRRSEGMMRRHPLLGSLVPLEHWEVCDPEKTKILSGVAGLFENAVTVGVLLRQCKAQQAGGSVDGELLRRDFAMRGHGGLRARLRGAGDEDDEIAFHRTGFLGGRGSIIKKIVGDAFEIFENLC